LALIVSGRISGVRCVSLSLSQWVGILWQLCITATYICTLINDADINL